VGVLPDGIFNELFRAKNPVFKEIASSSYTINTVIPQTHGGFTQHPMEIGYTNPGSNLLLALRRSLETKLPVL